MCPRFGICYIGNSTQELKGLGVYKVIAIIKLLYINSMEMYQSQIKTTPHKEHNSSKRNPETKEELKYFQEG